jgi:hypothetical protein
MWGDFSHLLCLDGRLPTIAILGEVAHTDFKTTLFLFLIASFPGLTDQAFSGKQLSRCFSSDRW